MAAKTQEASRPTILLETLRSSPLLCMGELTMPRKLVVDEEANGRPDVGKLWCGFAEDTRGYERNVVTRC